jgi:hypothetical protein
MTRRLSLAFLSVIFVYGLSIGFAPRPALADSCDNAASGACLSECRKDGNASPGSGGGCVLYCLQRIEERKKKGQCKQALPRGVSISAVLYQGSGSDRRPK